MESGEMIGRREDLEALWEILRDRSLLLIGPRRVGKSTLLDAMAEQPRSGWLALRVDLEGARSSQSGVDHILRSLRASKLGAGALEEAASRVSGAEIAGVGVQLNPIATTDPWSALEEGLERAVRSMPQGKRLLLALDELPWWLDAIRQGEDPAAARVALAALRRLRQRHDLAGRLRMLLTGSIGLAGLAKDLGASAELNDVTPLFELRPLDNDSGATLFETVVTTKGRLCDPQAAKLGHNEAGGLPHWLSSLAERAAMQVPKGDRVTNTVVQGAVDALLEPKMRNLFDDEGRDHLLRRHGRETAAQMKVALTLASEPDGAPLEAVLTSLLSATSHPSRSEAQEIVYRLMDEFYLEQRGDRLAFRLPLFRRWWQRYGRDS